MRALLLLSACAAIAGCSAIVSPDTTRLHPEGDGSIGQADAGGVDAPSTPIDAPVEVDSGPQCNGTEPYCDAGMLVTCSGGIPAASPCPLGCSPDGSRCAVMIPSNVEESLWDPSAPSVSLEGAVRFDTGTCASTMARSQVVRQASGVEVCVLQVRDLVLEDVALLAIEGERPLVVMASGDVEIRGVLDASARLAEPGPGAVRSGDGSFGGHVPAFDDGGGGGGGFCGAGASGGLGGAAGGGRGGMRVDPSMLQPLRGGSAGGNGSGGGFVSSVGGVGGGGGGAIQISAQGRIRVSGTIGVGGGGGSGGRTEPLVSNVGAGGGGGSGGGILLEAPEVRFEDSAVLAATGGGGGGGGARTMSGGPGQDGARRTASASGGASGGTLGAPGGASGAGASIDASGGGSNTAGGGNGGGGGGGAGCIAIRTAEGAIPDGTSAGWSPSAAGVSVATVLTR
jgi:hypothetical protein